ncbi:hypothetical protein JKF63_06486 [Porcisia hertigi]|uniref:RRM domain-containing protein n=1 Tax=Porcisia hertigi TaxID=2761500 RepID=A0A836HXE7_9TRYP|nr:hypothetical protein JKF63_06486 [Porcisia hertigi]
MEVMTHDAAVVYVFLDDADKAVSMQDVEEWLQILNEVLEIKLQFDAATKRPCYYVRFRSAAAAQQAVQYLNGARLKNCVVTIQSHVYAAQSGTQTEAASATAPLLTSGTAATQMRERCRETAELPFNHLLPPDLQMDWRLAECLPDLEKIPDYAADGTTMWQKLQGLQKELVEIYRELETTASQVASTDAQLTQLLQRNGSGSPTDGLVSFHAPAALCGRHSALQACHYLSHQQAIPFDAHTPIRVIALLTDSFGPLSLCSETVTQGGFFLGVRFVFAADEERFLAVATSSPLSVANEEGTPRQGTEWRSIVQGLGWGPRQSISAVHELFAPTVDPHLQRTVRELLA